jgi:hypothetical protein
MLNSNQALFLPQNSFAFCRPQLEGSTGHRCALPVSCRPFKRTVCVVTSARIALLIAENNSMMALTFIAGVTYERSSVISQRFESDFLRNSLQFTSQVASRLKTRTTRAEDTQRRPQRPAVFVVF